MHRHVADRAGLGDEDTRYGPAQVAVPGSAVVAVTAGTDGSFFIDADGAVCACGSNEHNKVWMLVRVRVM